MKSNINTSAMSLFEIIVKYFGAIMAVIYVAGGLLLLLESGRFFNMPHYYSVPLGTVLTLYGAFRGYRVYKKYFQTSHENDN